MRKSNARKTIDKLYKAADKATDKIEEIIYAPLYDLKQHILELEEELQEAQYYIKINDPIFHAKKMQKYATESVRLYEDMQNQYDGALDYIKELEGKIAKLEAKI
jgi:prephenate dehydrogenase